MQLLTIHGSKGLEWDAVAVVRLVKDELPSVARDTKGWLGFGVLPYEFRGDARWLPALRWQRDAAPTQQDLKAAIDEFVAANRARQLEEDRRLAYVAVTRARDHLLLTGSSWSGTRKPRERERVLRRDGGRARRRARRRTIPARIPTSASGGCCEWPIDPLGARRAAVERAAAAVDGGSRRARCPSPIPSVALLLAERADRRHAHRRSRAPTRIAASRYKEFVADYAGTVGATRAPAAGAAVPPDAARHALPRVGRAAVGRASGIGGSLDDALWEVDDDAPGHRGVRRGRRRARRAARELPRARSGRTCGRSRSRPRSTSRSTGLDGRPHIVICKLDAVYRRDDRGGRIEIVDWKTGAAPRGAAETSERMLQLELYRQAYHARHGVPLDEIDVALYYVARRPRAARLTLDSESALAGAALLGAPAAQRRLGRAVRVGVGGAVVARRRRPAVVAAR